MALRGVALAVGVALLVAAVGCGSDGGETGGTGGDSSTSAPVETSDAPADPLTSYYVSDLTEAPTGELPPPLPEPALDELTADLVETVRENASAAAVLSQYSDLSSVEPADVASIENDACQVSAQAAVDRLAQVAPRADLAALPAVNLITGQIADCGPATADSFSNAAFSFLLRNTSTTPSGQETEAPSLSPVYDAACKGFKRGIAGRINRWLKIRGGARYGVTLAVGAALESCPEHVESVLAGL